MIFDEVGSSIELCFDIPLDHWVGKLNKKFPNIGFRFLAIMPIANLEFIINSIVSFVGDEFEQLEQTIETMSSIMEYQLLQTRPVENIYRIKARGHIIYFIAIKYNLIVDFPIIIKNNQAYFKIVGAKQEISKFLDDDAIQNIGFTLRRIGKYNLDQLKTNLTLRQLHILKCAKEEGFYDIPRRITLTELARKENMSKSTLSKIIQRIHRNFLSNIQI